MRGTSDTEAPWITETAPDKHHTLGRHEVFCTVRGCEARVADVQSGALSMRSGTRC
jgi:hypothetical protein